MARNVIVKPKAVPLPRDLIVSVSQFGSCEANDNCIVIYTPGQREAASVTKSCQDCNVDVHRFTQAADGRWSRINDYAPPPKNWPVQKKAETDAIKAGKVDIREVRRRQVYVDGKPVGTPFE